MAFVSAPRWSVRPRSGCRHHWLGCSPNMTVVGDEIVTVPAGTFTTTMQPPRG
jgi:hypothetical protein